MNASTALDRLRGLGVPVIKTADAAAALEQSTSAVSHTLARLARARLVTALRHGVWMIGEVVPLALPEQLSAPFPSYVSMQSALHYHGLIEQIPQIIYAASLARTQRVKTRVGTFSFHHLAPEVFGGFDELSNGAKMATPEKALFDVAYLSAGKTRLFASLPELTIPKSFRRRELTRWLATIPKVRSRTITEQKLGQFLSG